MKNFLIFVFIAFSIQLQAQNDWIDKKMLTYSVKLPGSWKEIPSEVADELTATGPTPGFENKKGYLGTTLFIESAPSKYKDLDSVTMDYKNKLSGAAFLKDVKYKKVKKFKFNGVDAVEIIFTATIQEYSSCCRIFLFQYNNTYYEASITYDPRLNKKLLKEAYKVLESFKFL